MGIMRKFYSFILKLLANLLLIVIMAASIVILWDRQMLKFSTLVRTDPLPHTLELMSRDKLAEAHEYLEFHMDYDYVNQNEEAVRLLEELASKRSEYRRKAKKVAEGLVYGKSDEIEGNVSAVISDFLVIGDIRDGVGELSNWLNGREVDELTAALSGIGLAATAATAFSAGSSSSAKAGLSFYKLAHKLGKIPKWLNKRLIEIAKKVKKTRKLDSAAELLTTTYRVVDASGISAGMSLIHATKNFDDLKDMAKISAKFGRKTNVLIKTGGEDTIALIRKMDDVDKDTVLLASTYGKKGLKLLEKVGSNKFLKGIEGINKAKIWYKGSFWTIIRYFLSFLPTWSLLLVLLIGGGYFGSKFR